MALRPWGGKRRAREGVSSSSASSGAVGGSRGASGPRLRRRLRRPETEHYGDGEGGHGEGSGGHCRAQREAVHCGVPTGVQTGALGRDYVDERRQLGSDLAGIAREGSGGGGNRSNGRAAHREWDGGDGGAAEGSTATNLEKSVVAAGSDLAKQASYSGLPGSIPCGR